MSLHPGKSCRCVHCGQEQKEPIPRALVERMRAEIISRGCRAPLVCGETKTTNGDTFYCKACKLVADMKGIFH